jgi:hypothetical protein
MYSWDEGKSWNNLTISEHLIEVDNIIIEPTNTAEKFIVYGRKTTKGEDKSAGGVIIYVDFFPLHERYCVLPDQPDTEESDYETWSPNGKITPNCLLGRKTSYIRKKRDSKCFNDEKFEKWNFIEFCTCSEEDWECDYGYFRRNNQGSCVTESGVPDNFTVPEVCDDYYSITQGYRKVAGDTCKGGVDHTALKVPCPGRGILSSKNVAILIAIVGIIYSLVWVSNSSNTDKVRGLLGGIANKLKFKKEQITKGFAPIKSEVPDSLRDGNDDEDNRLSFEGDDDLKRDAEDPEETDEAKGKRMTKRQGLEAAQKKVPAVSRPGEKRQDASVFI